MDAVSLHLISNHVPIIGVFFGIVVLGYGMSRQSPPTLAAAYIAFLISAAMGLVAYFSGEGAEEVAEKLPGVTHEIIEVHEEAAVYTLVSYVVLALASLLGMLKVKNHYHRIRKLAIVILLLSIIAFATAAYTGYTGGQVRHTELRNTSLPAPAGQDNSSR